MVSRISAVQINAEGLCLTQMLLLRDLIIHRAPLKSRHFGLNPCVDLDYLSNLLAIPFEGVRRPPAGIANRALHRITTYYPSTISESGALDTFKCQEAMLPRKGRKWV